MNDPYRVLGVSPSASDDEIKKAYRELVRKYHPDNYHDNPLADLASEKMKEINEAYDAVTKSREQGGGAYSSGHTYGSGSSAYRSQNRYTDTNPQYAQIRQLITSNNLAQAEALLGRIPIHDAEWNYLMGSVYWRKGWMDEAGRCFQTAVNMDPGNVEYRNAVQYMNQGGQAYRPAGTNTGNMMNSDTACNLCSNLICADCCCEMMGGDLIPCC